jgi:hypothetical protein
MSCLEIERLFVSGESGKAKEHAASCPACAAAARDNEDVGRITSTLRPPVWSPSLREALLAVPSRTVSCELADELLAHAVDDEIGQVDRHRLDFHLSRCGACAEAAQTLSTLGDLVEPRPAPWFLGRVASATPARPTRSPKNRAGWRWLLDPKAAIGLAYAAAIAVMLLGFNPADLARKARTDLPVEARSVVADAKTTLADRVGAFGEKAVRTAMVVKSRVFGYGRAALSNAVQLVMKSEAPPARSRPRNGDEKGSVPKSETANPTWRA